MINLNSNKKQIIGVSLGIITFIVTQIILRLINVNETNIMIIVGGLMTSGIVFAVSFNLENNKLDKKPKIILTVLFSLMCILMSIAIIMVTICSLQSQAENIFVITIFILAIVNLIVFIVYLVKLVKEIHGY